ncbi:MAG: phosphoadenylyl-sulfate reductase [Thermodesulfobacteriota bacterium]
MSLSGSISKKTPGPETGKRIFAPDEVRELNLRFERGGADEVLRWAYDNLHPRVALASSFQAQGMVLIDMLMAIDSGARIFTLDTGRLNQETYDIMDEVRKRYGARIEVVFPDKTEVEEMVLERGVNLFYKGKENRILCCDIRKVRPLRRYLVNMDGWITSIRRDQLETRAEARKFEIDEANGGILKINPLVDWTSKMVWDYIKERKVPYNKLHDMGYPSIGCAPCTRAVKPGEDERAGRWWWENDSDKECGLHFNHNGD